MPATMVRGFGRIRGAPSRCTHRLPLGEDAADGKEGAGTAAVVVPLGALAGQPGQHHASTPPPDANRT
jgi:hypothetical protein